MKNEDYTERAKRFEKDDFWKQVRRTVNGKDVSDDQSTTHAAIKHALKKLEAKLQRKAKK